MVQKELATTCPKRTKSFCRKAQTRDRKASIADQKGTDRKKKSRCPNNPKMLSEQWLLLHRD